MARLTLKFPEKTNNILNNLAQKEEVSKTEILRRSLALYKYLTDEVHQDKGHKVAIADENDKVIKEIVITK